MKDYRNTDTERSRTADLLQIVPKNRNSVLDIGARDGHFSRLLSEYFPSVTALDLTKPNFELPGVEKVQGNVTALPFEDNSIDCVFCAEVLEHVQTLARACAEIGRVARHEIVIGVPYRQDTRVGRTTCSRCGATNPPWGHVNSFTEERISDLFPHLRVVSKTFIGTNLAATNALAAFLMDRAGNPWGTYSQQEPCIRCGAGLVAPTPDRPVPLRICSALAARIEGIQRAFTKPHANWMHLVLSLDEKV